MQFKHSKTIVSASDGIQKITAIAWSPNNRKIAAVSTKGVIFLYNEQGEQRDKITTKPAQDKGQKSYTISSLAFSPDSTRLAASQTDSIVFVYKIGATWGEKKSICNKYPQTSAVTCLCWPHSIKHQNDFFFGLAEGKVKLGNTKTNKSQLIYSTDEYVLSMCTNMEGNILLAGHIDGSIWMLLVDPTTGTLTKQVKLAQHPTPPTCLSWGESIAVSGGDRKVVFYDNRGVILQKFDFSSDDDEREFSSAQFNPTGQGLVVGSYNRFRAFTFSSSREPGKQWEEAGYTQIDNLYTVTSISWKRDGSCVAIGGLTGALELYDIALKKFKYKGKFEVIYVSTSQIVVKRIGSGDTIVLGAKESSSEITRLNVYNDRYLVAQTPTSIIIGDLDHKRKPFSEIPWQATGQEKFFFDNPGVAMIFNAGELTIVEHGNNEILGVCRTDHVSSHLISVRIDERRLNEEIDPNSIDPTTEIKRIAYLVDLQTIHILDLVTKTIFTTINHDSKIDWLELNSKGSKLLFRDKRRTLNLVDVATTSRITLLQLCSYVQWVPKSDVVVAQSRSDLHVWYSVETPEKATVFSIKGDVVDIERTVGRTVVIIEEGNGNPKQLELNEKLIAFGSAIENGQLEKAAEILETANSKPSENDALWLTLSQMALKSQKLLLSERCFAAIGDIGKVRYLHKLNRIAEWAEKELSVPSGTEYYVVKARLEALQKNYSKAEAIFLEQGYPNDAMELYQEVRKWEDSIRVAETYGYADVENLKKGYFQYLLETRQEERAALLKDKEGDYYEAVNLYLKAGISARAAQLVQQHNINQPDLLEKIAEALATSNLFEKSGFFFEKLGKVDRALENYRMGHSYRSAVELCRSKFPQRVVLLEQEWGDYLVSIGQVDQAINHYIEAGQYSQAIDAAIEAKQWNKAVSIVEGSLEPEFAKKYHKLIAQHYEETLSFDLAEKFFVKAGIPEEAVAMYSRANMWEAAHKLASSYMSQKEISKLYIDQGLKLEQQGKYKEAEKLYVTIGEQDLAINMYKKAGKDDDMIRLVAVYRKDFLQATHQHLAQQFEADGNYKLAEKHYIECGEWTTAVNMYRNQDMWEDALRVARQYGGSNASIQVVQIWAKSLGGDAGINMLLKFNMADGAVDFAIEIRQFRRAEEICRSSGLKKKLPEVYLKHAMFLEDEGKYQQAEAEFIKGGSAKDAVDMYVNISDWQNALRVAESHDPSSIAEVFEAQARAAIESKDFTTAEKFYVLAKKPEVIAKIYKDKGMFQDYERVVRQHMADKIKDIVPEAKQFDTLNDLLQRGKYDEAIKFCLSKNSENTRDLDQLQEFYENAVKLSMNHFPDRVNDVVRLAADKLTQIQRYAVAAELLEGIDAYKEAIDIYMKGEMWEQARALAASKATFFMDGVTETKITSLIEKGDWNGALALASQQGMEVLGKYTALQAGSLLKEGKFAESIAVFEKWGAIPIMENFALYKSLAHAILATPADVDSEAMIKSLRKVFVKFLSSLEEVEVSENHLFEFQRITFIVHLVALKDKCKHLGLQNLSAKVATSLLRYPQDVPADKLFYEAGIACREVNQLNMAFVFLNRYLDIADEIESGSAEILENLDFEKTDIPFDIKIPLKQYLNEERKEDAKTWILQNSVGESVKSVLNTRTCEHCGIDTYEASLRCHSCKQSSESCVVTGYPISRSNKINCTVCGKASNREDWNKWLLKTRCCPYCENPQNPSY